MFSKAEIAAIGELQTLRDALPKLPQPTRVPFQELTANAAASADTKNAARAARLDVWQRNRQQRERLATKCKTLTALDRAAGYRHRSCRLETFTLYHAAQQPVLDAVREYIGGIDDRLRAQQGVILYGPVGTGKDHLAFAICWGAADANVDVAWINGQEWFGALRDNIDSGRSERDAIGAVGRPTLLCISDPLPPAMARGDELTSYQASMLYRLVDKRDALGHTTILTVNVNDDAEAYRRLGAPTWDRLCHGAWKLRCAWPSFRRPSRTV